MKSRQEIYGLSSNYAKQQKQADDGTLLAARTVMIVGETLQSQRTGESSWERKRARRPDVAPP